MKHVVIAAILVGLLLARVGADPTILQRQQVSIRPNDIVARAEPDTLLVPYYTLSYSLPRAVNARQIERAILEVVVDVQAKSREGYVNEAPVLQVFALTRGFSGSIDAADIDESTRAVRPVASGLARHVKIDITNIVRAHASGAANHGLVVGSVTGMREGVFTIRINAFPEGAVGQVIYYLGAMTE